MSCFGLDSEVSSGFASKVDGENTDALITGVGIHATSFHLGRILALHSYDFAFNIGLAGALAGDLELGQVVEVVSDEFGDLGAEDHENYLDIFQLGFAGKEEFPYVNGVLMPAKTGAGSLGIRQVKGVTVNTVHGETGSILRFKKRSRADIETMEGAAFFYSCTAMKLPALQIRAISNYVEARNRNTWKVKEALEALTLFIAAKWPEITGRY